MACIEKIYSVSALIGNGRCNANCSFCSAKNLRKTATSEIPLTYKSAIKLSARYGGWSLSLTSSGEPTCDPESVTEALKQYKKCAKQGAYFPNVNLFSNGILLGDKEFCKKYLPVWKKLGLTAIAVSIHSVDVKKQRDVYNVNEYPDFKKIVKNVRKYGLQVRATLLLRKGEIDNPVKYKEALDYLISIGVVNITSWTIGNQDATRNEYTPSRLNMMRIRMWLATNTKKCHGHVWGGGVYDYNGTLVRLTDYVTRHDPKKDYVRQLVVFQDGTVAYSWIKEGALCMKM